VEQLNYILGAISSAIKIGITIAPILSRAIRNQTSRSDTESECINEEIIDLVDPGKLTQFIYKLRLLSESDVEKALSKWRSPIGFTDANRQELSALLKNLVRGARFHSTHGTVLSNYLSAEKLLEQLMNGIQPKMSADTTIGTWKLTTFLGMGGFGEVWKAQKVQKSLYSTPLVFKFFTQEGAKELLETEAEVLDAVKVYLKDCPNVIFYHDVEIDAQPYPYIMLEFATLGTLEDWILSEPSQRAKITITELIRGIVRGVSQAHKHGIYHRDLKPANVLLTGTQDDVTPKIADFGLGSVVNPADSERSYRTQRIIVGTNMYLPPEAANPFVQREFTQDDVFALGVIWFQILTGEISRPSYDFAEQLAQAGADSRSIKLIAKCLANPKRRYPTACELYDELDKEEPPPGPGEWDVPEGCFDVAGIAREYLEVTFR